MSCKFGKVKTPFKLPTPRQAGILKKRPTSDTRDDDWLQSFTKSIFQKKSKKNKNFVGGQEHSKDTPYSISRSETLYRVKNKCFYEEYASIL